MVAPARDPPENEMAQSLADDDCKTANVGEVVPLAILRRLKIPVAFARAAGQLRQILDRACARVDDPARLQVARMRQVVEIALEGQFRTRGENEFRVRGERETVPAGGKIVRADGPRRSRHMHLAVRNRRQALQLGNDDGRIGGGVVDVERRAGTECDRAAEGRTVRRRIKRRLAERRILRTQERTIARILQLRR